MKKERQIGARMGLPVFFALEEEVVETLELLLRKTGENGHTIALIYSGESADFVRGYVSGQIDALRLALDHVRDIAARFDEGEDSAFCPSGQ
jgi:hypothetical protein